MDDHVVKPEIKPFGVEYLEEIAIPPDFGSAAKMMAGDCCSVQDSNLKSSQDDIGGSYCGDGDMCTE